MKRLKPPAAQASPMLKKLLQGQRLSAPKPVAPTSEQFSEALALHRAGKLEQAVAVYDAVIGATPLDIVAHSNRGSALFGLGRNEEAVESCQRAIAINQNFDPAHSNMGNALRALGRLHEALASYDRAIQIQPRNPNTYSNRGAVLRALGRYEEAIASYDQAIRDDPSNAAAHYNRGIALRLLNQPEQAIVSYDRAIALNPDYTEAYWNRSLAYLLLGDFARGWPDHEWRWKTIGLKQRYRNFSQPLWLNDQALEGKTLLLHAEQGFGDTLQFFRYVAKVEELVQATRAKLLVEVQPSLVPLLSRVCSAHVFARGEALPEFDLQCPLLSLPLAFKTTLETIPAKVPYVFADDARLGAWMQRLGSSAKKRIGLAWAGSKTHVNDANRSMTLSLLQPLTQLNVELHALHNELRPVDEPMARQFGILSHAEQLTDFAETASLIAQMDLVISVDTSVAHLAGAMGKPVWILLPYAPDWRWLLHRTDSPWYPTATLFRQDEAGDWAGMVSRVAATLAALIEN